MSLSKDKCHREMTEHCNALQMKSNKQCVQIKEGETITTATIAVNDKEEEGENSHRQQQEQIIFNLFFTVFFTVYKTMTYHRYAKVRDSDDYHAMSEDDNCCFKLCTGRSHWLISILCFLPVLIWNSIRIYLIPCIWVLFARCCSKYCCYLCKTRCRKYYMYVDKNFPPLTDSLACADNKEEFRSSELANLTTLQIENKIEWIRASELNKHNEKMYLFEDGINPSDVVQGALGDCWLLAALAALAEFPGAIENTFLSLEHSSRGKYYFRLYDARIGKRKRVIIVIDDYIPCLRGYDQPLFSQPKGNEMWVLLLEKAFAKFCGGYSELKGGHAMWAMHVITGDHVFRLEYSEKEHCWSRWDIEYGVAESANPKKDWLLKDTKQRFDHEKIWQLLLEYDEHDALITASVSNRKEHINESEGIVEGHTYTIKQVRSIGDYRLLNLRNPWGSFEWKGDWSDGSGLWNKHKDIAKKLKFVAADDGLFWMEYKDFFRIYNVIQICDRSTIRNLHLDVKEDEGQLGVMKGCCVGCGQFWCMCQGLRKIYFGRVSSEQTRDTNSCCPCFKKEGGSAWIER